MAGLPKEGEETRQGIGGLPQQGETIVSKAKIGVLRLTIILAFSLGAGLISLGIVLAFLSVPSTIRVLLFGQALEITPVGICCVSLGVVLIREFLKNRRGRKVTIGGFGTFLVSRRAERNGRNPRTGKAIKIPACRVPRFKPSRTLKHALQ